MNIFEKEYSKTSKKNIFIDVNSILKNGNWLPGAEELMGVLSSRPDDTEITIYADNSLHEELNKIFRRSRVFCTLTSDPVMFSQFDIIISPKTGIGYIDFSYVTEFITKLDK